MSIVGLRTMEIVQCNVTIHYVPHATVTIHCVSQATVTTHCVPLPSQDISSHCQRTNVKVMGIMDAMIMKQLDKV